MEVLSSTTPSQYCLHLPRHHGLHLHRGRALRTDYSQTLGDKTTLHGPSEGPGDSIAATPCFAG